MVLSLLGDEINVLIVLFFIEFVAKKVVWITGLDSFIEGRKFLNPTIKLHLHLRQDGYV